MVMTVSGKPVRNAVQAAMTAQCQCHSRAFSARDPQPLADDTGGSSRDGGKALRIDVRFAFYAASKSTSINAPKCSLHLAEAAGIALDIANRDVALAGVLDSVQLIRTGLDSQSFAVPLPFSPVCSPRFFGMRSVRSL
jgi:hypothetical protein